MGIRFKLVKNMIEENIIEVPESRFDRYELHSKETCLIIDCDTCLKGAKARSFDLMFEKVKPLSEFNWEVHTLKDENEDECISTISQNILQINDDLKYIEE